MLKSVMYNQKKGVGYWLMIAALALGIITLLVVR